MKSKLIKLLFLILIFNSCKENSKDKLNNKIPFSFQKSHKYPYGQIDSCVNCFNLSFLHNKDTSEFYYFGYSLTPDGNYYSYLEIKYNDSIKYCKEYDLINHEIIREGHIELEKIESKKINHNFKSPLYQFKVRRTKTWVFHKKDSKTIIYYPQLKQKIKVIEINNDGKISIDSSRLYDYSYYYNYNYLIF